MLAGLCCLCCVGCCVKRRCARRRHAVPVAAARAAEAVEGLQLAEARSELGSDLGSDDEALSPLEVEPAAPPPAAWQRRKSRMEAAGTAKLLEACPSDAICHEP